MLSMLFDPQREAERTLDRLLPRIEPLLHADPDRDLFLKRLKTQLPQALRHLVPVYSGRYDFFYHLEMILATVAQAFLDRPADLRALDVQREAHPAWFQQETMIGGVLYVDLFAGDLDGVRAKIPYFKDLGLTYLHLMPLYAAPEVSDGGYAVSDYRQVHPDLGTMDDLRKLAAELRQNGISLVLDFVFNHTSDEHTWAQQALAGDADYQDYYYMFPDRALPDAYEEHLREIFPEQAPGSFTHRQEIDRWVWTTFNRFQWDLNYSNPAVFRAMLDEMLYLANVGTEVLRLDAVAFIWKQLGTPCENLPQVHDIIRGFNALVKVAAPAMVFKSEAIVHPDDVASYISPEECQLSYNPTFMALIWEALATREVKLLRHSMSKRFALPEHTAWVNYVRVHDDIGWSFADEDAREVNITGFDHRQFLNRFYTGQFPMSYATGLGFNFNPRTLDMRICGTAASLAGLEAALKHQDAQMIEHALRRIIMIHSLIIAAGGIPLLYMGDEIATLNDYDFRTDPNKALDSRWVHRPAFDWQRAAQRSDAGSIPGKVFTSLQKLIAIRRGTPDFGDGPTLFFDTLNPHVLGFVRNHRVLVLANFSDTPQTVKRDVLAAYWHVPAEVVDLYTGQPVTLDEEHTLVAWTFQWLCAV